MITPDLTPILLKQFFFLPQNLHKHMTKREIEYYFGVKDPDESKSHTPVQVVSAFIFACWVCFSVCGSEVNRN